LHSSQGNENDDANFTILKDGEYQPIPEDEVRAYIRLTRSVTTDQKKVRPSSSGPIFINRAAELRVFEKMLDDPSQSHILLVTGPARIGKSFLLQCYAGECSRRGIWSVRIDGSYLIDEVDFMKRVHEALPNWDFSEFEYMAASKDINPQRIYQAFRQGWARVAQDNKVVIFLDGYELLSQSLKDWFAHEFLLYVDDLPNIIVCVAGREVSVDASRLRSRIVKLPLEPFSKDDIANYLKALDLDVSTEAADALYRATGGNPATFAQASDLMTNRDRS